MPAWDSFTLAAIGSIVLFFGFNLWVPMTYTWSTEVFPTRARATGFALADGVGHLGGSVGILLLICVGIVAAAILAQFGPATRDKRLDEVSP